AGGRVAGAGAGCFGGSSPAGALAAGLAGAAWATSLVDAAPWAAPAGAAEALSPTPASTAISVPTSTVVPSATRILLSVPSPGEGISTLILSVWISTSGSSLRTRSPSALSHLATVPSATLSPSCGTTIEIGIVPTFWLDPNDPESR